MNYTARFGSIVSPTVPTGDVWDRYKTQITPTIAEKIYTTPWGTGGYSTKKNTFLDWSIDIGEKMLSVRDVPQLKISLPTEPIEEKSLLSKILPFALIGGAGFLTILAVKG